MTTSTSTAADFSGTRALVTGGTRGIGAATARQLAAGGAEVVVAARTHPRSMQPAKLRFVTADVTTADGVASLAEQALDLLGGIDIVISNAGGQTLHPEGILHFTDEDWQHDLAANLLSATRLDRALVPAMISQGSGAIVHVGSNAARIPRPASLPYSAAKAALTVYSKGLAKEVGPHGIRVNTVLPGIIESDAFTSRMATMAERAGEDPDSIRNRVITDSNIPLARPGTVDEAANLITFLVSRQAAYLTGSQFTIDGGLLPTL